MISGSEAQRKSKLAWISAILSDSALPVGGFVASNGLESSLQQSQCRSLSNWINYSLLAIFHQTFPFIRRIFNTVCRDRELDEMLDIIIQLDKSFHANIISNHVQARASTTQGQSYLALATNSFASLLSHSVNIQDMGGDPSLGYSWLDLIASFKESVRKEQCAGHLVICFGLLCRGLGLEEEETVRIYLFMHCRTAISTAIRLGMIGPYKGQELLLEFQTQVHTLVERSLMENLPTDNLLVDLDKEEHLGWGTNPILDILQGGHDRLYSRLFNS